MTNALTFGFIYCRTTPTDSEIVSINKHFKECNVLMGDLNLSQRIPIDQEKVISLCQETKVNALKEITRSISGNQLDYILIDEILKSLCFVTSYNNFISDHKSITARIGLNGNQLTNDVKQKLTFDRESHLKAKRKEQAEESSTRSNEDSTSDQSFGSHLTESSYEDQIFGPLPLNTSEDTVNDDQTLPQIQPFGRKFQNQDMATCWLNSCLQLILALIDHSDPPVSLTSDLGNELIRLKQNVNGNILDPTVAKGIIVTSEDTRIAMRLSELSMELTDQTELENRSRAVESLRFDLGSGQQCVRDFFLCLQANVLSWPDVCSSLYFKITHSTTCLSCNHVQGSETTQMFVEMPVPPDNTSLDNHVSNHLNCGSLVGVFCEYACQKLVQVERNSKLTLTSEAEFLTVILT